MNERGLKREFDVDGYVDRVNSIETVERKSYQNLLHKKH